ncbi:MAG TPA: DUF3422 domain-containing protein [Sphingomonas sp.]|uniref:DUF3422 family protein n=1 Tax=Sphingomonas sp. TaxID=28214 RepID=UPI002ED98F9F
MTERGAERGVERGVDRGIVGTVPTLRSHPLRASLSEEMHVRKLPQLAAPLRLMQIVTLMDEDGIAASQAHVVALCAEHGAGPDPASRYFVCRLDGHDFVWERHTEVATYTFVATGHAGAAFGCEPFGDAVNRWVAGLPGEVLRATHVALVEQDADVAPLITHFAMDDLVVCDVAQGRARIWSDFRLHADGFGRLVVRDQGLVGYEAAQLVQRLQELGNYRNMALLGLPLAQRLTPEVSRLEQRLATLTAAVAERVSQDDTLLDELSFLSAQLARLMAETSYRLSATRAYAQLSSDRLAALQVGEVRGHPTLADFTARRLAPAVRTCESFSHRLEGLSQRVAWTSSLLRTRVDTALARQNRDLLDSMDRRTGVQVRLQQAVEGLSVVAISYYLVGLFGYVVKSMHGIGPVPPEVATGMAVPVVIALVAFVMARIRRHAHAHARGGA